MPTYEYECTSCGHNFDIVQSFRDDALSVCPECGGTLRKIFGNIGIVLKGSGFYKNDSRSGNGSHKEDRPSSTKKESVKADSTKGSSGDASSGEKTSTPAKTDGGTGGSEKPKTSKKEKAAASTPT
jgi:putative FmdB family regulatory protein